jgi:hypothetical protein
MQVVAETGAKGDFQAFYHTIGNFVEQAAHFNTSYRESVDARVHLAEQRKDFCQKALDTLEEQRRGHTDEPLQDRITAGKEKLAIYTTEYEEAEFAKTQTSAVIKPHGRKTEITFGLGTPDDAVKKAVDVFFQSQIASLEATPLDIGDKTTPPRRNGLGSLIGQIREQIDEAITHKKANSLAEKKREREVLLASIADEQETAIGERDQAVAGIIQPFKTAGVEAGAVVTDPALDDLIRNFNPNRSAA